MCKNLPIITYLLFSLIYAASSTLNVVHQETDCNPNVKNEVVSFYYNNRKTYDIFVPTNELSNLECKMTIYNLDGIPRTVAYINLEKYKFSGLHKLIIFHEDAFDGWTYEDESEVLDLYKDSLNVLIQENKIDRKTRNKTFWINVLKTVNDKFDFNKKQKYFWTLSYMSILGFDSLLYNWVVDFYSVYLVKENPYLNEEFLSDLEEAVLDYGKTYFDTLFGKLKQILSQKIEKEVFEKVKNDSEFIKNETIKVYNALKGHLLEDNKEYGRNSIAVKANEKFSPVTIEELKNFFVNYDTSLNPNLDPFDYEHPVPEKDGESKLLEELGDIEIYKIQYFVLQKFEMIGMKRSRYSYGSVRAPTDTCKLTDFEKEGFTKLAEEKLILNQELSGNENLVTKYVSCEKETKGNKIYFRIVYKPYSEDLCEIVFEHKQISLNNSVTEILFDTNDRYTNIVSCDLQTRKAIEEGENQYLII